MNVFLIIVILAMGGGGFYEYTQLQQASFADQQKIADLNQKVSDLTAQNKKLAADADAAIKSSTSKQADFGSQLQAAQQQTAAAQAKSTELETQLAAAKAEVEAMRKAPNELGDFTTLDGKKFTRAMLLKQDSDGITFSHTAGITKVMYPLLPLDLQHHFGFGVPAVASTPAPAKSAPAPEPAPETPAPASAPSHSGGGGSPPMDPGDE